ncbi:hypothetical protein [Streptomyces sp. NPDC093094]|uniref:hypothetical protein n=1 Tax=Streptomyces sp. NPDC093094 TaxID=3366026 RepID=UPI00381F01C9
MNTRRRRRHAAVVLTAVALGAVLTGCKGDEGRARGAGPADPGPAAEAGATPGGTSAPTGTPAPPSGTGGGAGSAAGGGTGSGTGKGEGPGGAKPGAPAGPATTPPAGAGAAGCVSGPPVPDDYDPDEFALYGYEELAGVTDKVNLIVRHGAWGCPGPDTDGAPFVVSGEESRWALGQGAYVTATNPVVESTENRRIGVQELLDWLDAHPGSGLVFRYETGDDEAVHRLDEVFTP